MKKESGFQKSAIDCFRKSGFFCVAGSTVPGYPDLTVIRNSRAILVELKDITGVSAKSKISAIFEKTQIPFYLRNYHAIGKILVLIKRDSSYFLFAIWNLIEIKKLMDLSIADILFECVSFGSIKEAVEFITL